MTIDRREAIRRVTLALGGVTFVGGSGLLAACERYRDPRSAAGDGVGSFPADDVAFLDEVAETIFPETATPGAKAAQVGAFMALMVTDTYDAEAQAAFRTGMETLDETSRARHGAGFVDVTPDARLELLETFDRERFTFDGPGPHWFEMMKQLAALGYFTSEIGCTVAQQYVEAPGRFDPCAPYTPGDRNQAAHA